MVINELPVGSKVRLGRYSLPHNSGNMFDIDWIKTSKQNEFISEKVLCGMQFDPMEGFNQNCSYPLSNIRQFMNSECHSWFHPAHSNDCGPGYIMLDSYIRTPVHRYAGLLSFFADEEIALLDKFGTDYMRLPTMEEIDGGFQYFKRHGKRAHPITAYGIIERNNFKETMYSRYYVLGDSPYYVYEVDRSGNFATLSPAVYSGVRPVCKIKCNAEVIQNGENTYKMNLSSAGPVRFFKETQPINWLLGI